MLKPKQSLGPIFLALFFGFFLPSSLPAQDGADELGAELTEYRNGNLQTSKKPFLVRDLVGATLKIYEPLSLVQTRNIVDGALIETKYGKVVQQSVPKLSLFIAYLFKDSEALYELAKIVDNRERLKTFGLWSLGTIVLAFLLKRILRGEHPSFFKWLFRFTFIYAVRFVLLIGFFGEQFAPSFRIFKKVFFS